MTHIDLDQLNALKKKSKKEGKRIKKRWEVYTTQRVGPKQRKVPKELSIGESNRQYADVRVMEKDPKTGKGKMLCALLDLVCTKSIILKKFTLPEAQTRLNDNDCCIYQTYGGHFTSSSVALIAFGLVEFNKNKDLWINYKFQVDEVNIQKNSKYNMIIGNDILHDLQIDLLFSEERRENWM